MFFVWYICDKIMYTIEICKFDNKLNVNDYYENTFILNLLFYYQLK
jgi:hypothetical protein